MAALLATTIIIFTVITRSFSLINFHRLKRDVDVAEALCIYSCFYTQLNHSLFENSGEEKTSRGSMICRHVEIQQLENVCNVYKQSKTCLSECPSGPLKTMVDEALTYGCVTHYDEFKKYTPCFTDSCKYLENTCRPRCGLFEEAIHYTPEEKRKLNEIRKFSSQWHSGESDASDIEDGTGLDILGDINLVGACKFIDCSLNCTQEPLTAKCGHDTYKFFRRVVLDLSPMAYGGLFPNITTPPEDCKIVFNTPKEPPTQAGWTLKAGGHCTLILVLFSLLFKWT